ncbi:MAG TPA: GNAT family N-acetyltransferase, partial [Pontibacter sp.]
MNFTHDLHLENSRVLLRPLRLTDLAELQTIAFDDTIWRYMIHRIATPEDLQLWAKTAFTDREKQQRY